MAGYLPLMALRDGGAFRNLVRGRGVGGRGLLSLALFVCLSCAVYGAVLGCWRSPLPPWRKKSMPLWSPQPRLKAS